MTIVTLFPPAPISAARQFASANPLFTPTSALKTEFTASFNGFTYCPFDPTEVAVVLFNSFITQTVRCTS